MLFEIKHLQNFSEGRGPIYFHKKAISTSTQKPLSSNSDNDSKVDLSLNH